MNIDYYNASGGRSATIHSATRGDTMRIEAQAGTYAIGWTTDLEPHEVIHELGVMLPDAVIGEGSSMNLSVDELRDPSGELLTNSTPKESEAASIYYFRLYLGEVSVTWGRLAYDGEPGRHEIAISGEAQTLDLAFVRDCLARTAASSLREQQTQLVSETRQLLGTYLV